MAKVLMWERGKAVRFGGLEMHQGGGLGQQLRAQWPFEIECEDFGTF